MSILKKITILLCFLSFVFIGCSPDVDKLNENRARNEKLVETYTKKIEIKEEIIKAVERQLMEEPDNFKLKVRIRSVLDELYEERANLIHSKNFYINLNRN